MKITDFIIESKVLVETRTPNQILLELNVINIPQIDTFLADIAQNLPTKETQKWFTSRAKKYLINSEEDNAVITHFSGKAEPWMKARQKEGVQMYRFNPSHDLTTKLAHVVDWVRAMNDTVTGVKAKDQQSIARAKKALKGLNNTSIAQAVELSNQWVTDMNSGKDSSYKRPEDETGLVPVMVHGEFKWYKLTDQDCLDREGKVMGHCVASYGSSVKSGKTVIYSLRDNNNFAHATVEVHSGRLEQVKGKRNAPPVAKYQRATVALLNTLNVPPTNRGLNDIHGMDFLYNANNHKYGTVQDIGDKVYDENNISVWSIGGKTADTISMRILVGDRIVCNIGTNKYGSRFEYQVKDVDAMLGVKVNDAKYRDPMYRLAKFITQVIPQTSTSNVNLGDLSSYMGVLDDTRLLAMFEGMGELVFTDANSVLRFVLADTSDNRDDMYMHLTDGKHISNIKYNDEDSNIGDRKTLTGTGYGGLSEKTNDIVVKYINTMKPKDRPIIQDSFIFQHPTTFEAGTDVANASETIAVSKSGEFGWYKIINADSNQNSSSARRRRQYSRFSTDDLTSVEDNTSVTTQYVLVSKNGQRVINIDLNEDETKHKFNIYDRDTIRDLSQADAIEVANLFNKSGMNKYYPFTNSEVVSLFEENGLYFLREKRMFTTDHSIAGEQFKHEDKEFKAIKTHNHLKIYHKDVEVVVFDLDNDIDSAGVKAFHLRNKLTMLNNVRKIADVLNHYDIHRKDQNRYDYNMEKDTNRKIAQAGLTYSYENGWNGMKNGPKPIKTSENELTRTIGKSEYEIHSFKRDFLIQNAGTHELVATLKGFKNVNDPVLYISKVKMENQKDASFDIVADALNELHQRDGVKVRLDSGSFKNAERFDFNYKMHERGYTGTKGDWESIVNKYPSEVISKGPGGTWIKEAFASSDSSIEAQQNTNNRYRDDQTSADKAMRKYHGYPTGLGGDNYTLYSRKTPVLRAFVGGDNLQIIYIVTSDGDGNTVADAMHTQEELLKYGNAIGRLLHKLEIGGGKYLTDHQLYIAKGKLKDITKNPKLAGFTSGEIVYEDGHKWKQGNSRYRENEWNLSITTDDGKIVNLITVKIDGNGIDSIRFSDPKVKKYTKLYRPFLNDIMDIVDQLYGSD
jgi:hypothetical protein